MGALNRSSARQAATLAATLAACTVLYIGSTRIARVVKLNLTDSMPLGLYLMRPAAIVPGRIVVACPPAAAARLGLRNGYLLAGSCASGVAPVLKYVVATGGSRIRVSVSGIAIGGRALANSAAHRRDRRGRLIPRVANGTYRLSENQVWLYSPAPWSWDSRYFGPVLESRIVGTATPLLLIPKRLQ